MIGARGTLCGIGDDGRACGCVSDVGECAGQPGVVAVLNGVSMCNQPNSVCFGESESTVGTGNTNSPGRKRSGTSVSCCVPCTKATIACAAAPSITFQTGTNTGVCATLASSTIVIGDHVEIVAWNFVGGGAPNTAPSDLTTAWLGVFNVDDFAVLDGVAARLDLTSQGRRIVISPTAPCQYLVEFIPLLKRQAPGSFAAVGGPTTLASTAAGGDPHVKGMFDIDVEVFGKPGANYSLVVAPAFEVNMQVADRGPTQRFMTHMAVLFRGQTIAFDAWSLKSRKAALIKQFEALGSAISINGWVMTIDVCPSHQLVFTAHSAPRWNINFLNFEMRVPGCHSAYGGLLGQTYQCRWATAQFQWSRDQEDAFVIPALTTPSGSYSAATECAHEDKLQGTPVSGGIAHSTDDAAAKMTLHR